jgi:hypothetical protein
MLPDNIALLVGQAEGSKEEAIKRVLSKPGTLKENLLTLGKLFKLKVWFKEPVRVRTVRRKVKLSDTSWQYKYLRVSDVHVFSRLFLWGPELCYTLKKDGRNGYPFPNLDFVIKYEIVNDERKDEFESFDEFWRRFDPQFITEAKAKSLWNSMSAQHGGRYRPSDFHKIGPVGKKVLEQFMHHFKGVESGGGEGYRKSPYGEYTVHDARHYAFHSSGRDISISHQTNLAMVHYSSEYAGCGNGRYGILANKSTFLWLEDD